MKLELQVASLELARKLKELGVKQESLFYWNHYKSTDKGKMKWELCRGVPVKWDGRTAYYSAFTVAELGEMLPEGIKISRNIDCHNTMRWWVEDDTFSNDTMCEYSVTEADCRAKILIYLIESKLITLQK